MLSLPGQKWAVVDSHESHAGDRQTLIQVILHLDEMLGELLHGPAPVSGSCNSIAGAGTAQFGQVIDRLPGVTGVSKGWPPR